MGEREKLETVNRHTFPFFLEEKEEWGHSLFSLFRIKKYYKVLGKIPKRQPAGANRTLGRDRI